MSMHATMRLTADEFLVWAEAQPTGRYQLIAGEIIAMAPEKADHARSKGSAWAALKAAINVLACPAKPSSMAWPCVSTKPQFMSPMRW